MRRVLLIGTNKFDVLPALQGRPDLDVHVLTEPWYVDRYAAAGFGVTAISALGRWDEALTWARPDHARAAFTAVIASSERSVPLAGFLRDQLGIAGTSLRTAVRYTSKDVMKETLVAHGVRVAPFRVAEGQDRVGEAIASLGGGPVILKSTTGTGGSSCVTVDGPDDWATARSRLPRSLATAPLILVESRLEVADEYALDALHAGETLFTAVSRYFAPLFPRAPLTPMGGVVSVVEPRRDELLALQQACVRALGPVAATHLEILEDSDGVLHVGEIAARPGGGATAENLQHSFGVDIWAALIALELGEDVPALSSTPRRPTGWFCLPAREGVLTGMTPIEEIMRVPGVVAAELTAAPGERLHASAASSARVGHVVVDAVGAERAAAQVLAMFEVRVAEGVAS